jgi:hypothetical protein
VVLLIPACFCPEIDTIHLFGCQEIPGEGLTWKEVELIISIGSQRKNPLRLESNKKMNSKKGVD